MIVMKEDIDSIIKAVDRGDMHFAVQKIRTHKVPFNVIHTRMLEVDMDTWNLAVLADMLVAYLTHND